MLSRYREPLRVWTEPVGRTLLRVHLRPNQLTVIGLGVSLLAAAAFGAGRVRTAGGLLILAGLCDFFDGALARASGQVTAFGAFLDSVIDRYSDLVVLLGIVVLFSRAAHMRGAVVAMAGLVGTMMVSYTKARAESIGVDCQVGLMERPERMLCLIAGALLGLLEPALWVLAVLANLTALQRIVFTRGAARDTAALRVAVGLALALPAAAYASGPEAAAPTPALERRWTDAVAAYRLGDAAPLVREFATEAALASPIGDRVRFVLAEALARQGALEEARRQAVAVAERHPESRLAPGALLLAATLAARAGDLAGEQALLVRLLAGHPDAPLLAQALYLLGQSGEALGQREAAARAYRELTVRAPASDWAAGAEDRLVALADDGVAVPALTPPQRLERAERLLRAGAAAAALDEAAALADETEDDALLYPALRVVAEGARRLGRWDAAAQALVRATGRAPEGDRPGLELDTARLLARAGQREQALELLDRVAASAAEALAAEARWERARVLDESGRLEEAVAAYRAVVDGYPGHAVAGAALWRLGWLAWLGKDFDEASARWGRLAELASGRRWRLAALYWTGRARAEAGAAAEAATRFASVLAEAPRTYYGVLAAARVSAPPAPPRAALRLPADPRAGAAADPAFRRVELLFRIGLVEHAWDELAGLVDGAVTDPLRLYAASDAYAREERYHLALRILRRHFTSVAMTGDADLPRAFWEMVYPFGWRAAVWQAAARHGLDPFLVAAVVREESSFYPEAVSPAGARGLMQLMPATARPLARRVGLALEDDLLADPVVNLDLGARFLARLLGEFGDGRLAVAAYNAGPTRVRQWWAARSDNDVEVFVEQIPYGETRRFVKRVVLSWSEYRRIWGGPPTPRGPEP